jgi:fatty-acyl-CoA synthase
MRYEPGSRSAVTTGTGTTVGDLLERAAVVNPDHAALVFVPASGGSIRTWTFAELDDAAHCAAGYLIDRFAAGQRIGIWARNCPEWVILQLGIALAGLVLVPLNPASTDSEAELIIRDADVYAVFHDRDPVDLATGRADEPQWIELSHAAAVWTTGPGGRRSVDTLDIAQVQYTSGTTGRPKGALLTHAGLTTTPVIASRCLGLKPHPRWLNVTPLFHIGGCVLPVMGCLALGATHVLGERHQTDQVLDTLGSQRITFFGAVPAILWDLLERYDPARHDASALELLMSGGAPVPVPLIERIQQTFGARLVIAYGQTEAHGHIAQTDPFGPEDGVSVGGRIGQPLPHTQVRIVNSEGDPAAADEPGELLCQSPTLMQGYLGLPDETERALDPQGWLHTGDICRQDIRGELTFLGRRSELINRGGEKVVPGEVEAVLEAHPSVRRVAVIGVPDDRLGQRIAAFVVTEDANAAISNIVDGPELQSHLRRMLGRHKIPEIWRFVDELPLASSGKVDKADLLRRWTAEEQL